MNFHILHACRCWLIACLLVFGLVGCASQRKPINPGTGVVDVEVWVVLAANLNEQVGFRDNRGCRLNDTEIRDRIAGLQANSSMFGPNCVFNWSGNYTVIYDQEIPASRIQSVTAFWLNPNFLLWQNGYWNPDAVNVYFAGNVQAGGNPTGAWAYTLDPGVPGTFCRPPRLDRAERWGFRRAEWVLATASRWGSGRRERLSHT